MPVAAASLTASAEQLTQLIRLRRSVFPKQFTGEAVPEAIVSEMLENAHWAPTHKFTEPWRFVVFAGEGRKRLAEFQAALYQQTAGEAYKPAKYDKLLQSPLKASHIIAIGMARDPQGRVPEIEEVEAVACAVQNMHLTAAAHGVGAYWASGGITYREEAKAFFNLQPEDKLLGFLYIGQPAVPPLAPGKRKSTLAEKVSWVRE